MKRLQVIGAMLVFFVLSAAWIPRSPVVAQDDADQRSQAWEYKTVKVPPVGVSQMESDLNKLGAEAWELCETVVPFRRAEEEYVVSFIFRRPKR